MVAASDAVVVATVEKSSPGRSVGVASDTGGFTFTDVEVRIEDVQFGDLNTETVALEIDDTVVPESYDPNVERNRWDVPGTRFSCFSTRNSTSLACTDLLTPRACSSWTAKL